MPNRVSTSLPPTAGKIVTWLRASISPLRITLLSIVPVTTGVTRTVVALREPERAPCAEDAPAFFPTPSKFSTIKTANNAINEIITIVTILPFFT
jgi:hypothetical protein